MWDMGGGNGGSWSYLKSAWSCMGQELIFVTTAMVREPPTKEYIDLGSTQTPIPVNLAAWVSRRGHNHKETVRGR